MRVSLQPLVCLAVFTGCGSGDDGCERVWFADGDGDGFGGSESAVACTAPRGHVRDGGDCNDKMATVFPGADETCDGVDQDCDGTIDEELDRIWYADADGDGHGNANRPLSACAAPPRHVDVAGDCDDDEAAVHPGNPEVCDGLDNDCDGVIDAGAPGLSTWYADSDGDGYGNDLNDILACEAPPGFGPRGGDCDDGNPEAWPGHPERCDGADNDCDGAVDEDDALDPGAWYLDGDGDGHGAGPAVVACDPPPGHVAADDDCDDADPDRYPGAEEVCDQIDNDCDDLIDDTPVDASTWYRDADDDSFGDPNLALFVCPPGAGWLQVAGDCDDGDADVNPLGVEQVADGIDQDCDGVEICYVDADHDAWGIDQEILSFDWSCFELGVAPRTGDCDDAAFVVNPGQAELAYDGLDNDCDPATPDDDLDGDGYPHDAECDDLDPAINPAMPPAVTFTDVTLEAGLQALHWDPAGLPAHCMVEDMAGGGAAADFDRDGLVDLFVPRLYAPDLLFRNDGTGAFVEEGLLRGIDHAGTSHAAVWFDADTDGDMDLYVVSMGDEPNRLYIGDAGFFTEEAAARGADLPLVGDCSWNWGASAADVDGDGDLDLHLTAWQEEGELGNGRGRLLVNDGAGFFTNETLVSGLDQSHHATLTSVFGDIDGDRILDLAIVADWGGSSLFRGRGDGTFVEITGPAGVGEDENGHGGDLVDIDNDGDLDWFVSGIYDPSFPCPPGWGCSGNRFYINDGSGGFVDRAGVAGLRDGGWGWGAAFLDYDNDGDLDLAQAAGWTLPAFADQTVRLFENDGAFSFADVACQTGLDLEGQSRTVLPFDYDGDGDLDVFISENAGVSRLYRNDGGSDNAWVTIRLAQPLPNSHAVGARVFLQALPNGRVVRRDVHRNNNFAGTRPTELHFGLAGLQSNIYGVLVVWPDGAFESHFDLPHSRVVDLFRNVP